VELARDHDEEDIDDVPGETGVSGGNMFSMLHADTAKQYFETTRYSHICRWLLLNVARAPASSIRTCGRLRPRSEVVQSAVTVL